MDFDPNAVVEKLRAMQLDNGQLAEREAAEKRSEAARLGDVLKCFGVPRRIRDTLVAAETTQALEYVRAWMKQGEASWCLVLSADKGVGKSTAAGWWLSQIAAAVQAAPGLFRRWWPASELAAMDFYGEDFGQLCECQSLVLDDLGVEFNDQKGAFQSKLDRLLDARYREYRRTVITTNLAPKDFAERYGARVFDRLREGAEWQGIIGKSLRVAG